MIAADDSTPSDPPRDAPGPYRIATVAELTGVPEPTLRAWERRYGVPQPERSGSGYRLYAAEEVEQVRAMRRLCDEGMAAAEAARAVRDVPAKALPHKNNESSSTPTDAYGQMVDALVAAVERFDDQALEMQSRRLMMMGPPSLQFDRVLAPALRVIGDKWHAGTLSVGQEHLASQRFGLMLRDLIRLSAKSDAKHAVVLGCFADDEHELGLLGSALRFAEWGYRPIFLGSRTPPEAIRSAVQATQPALVALSITIAVPRARARALCSAYAEACGVTPWIVGGSSADGIADIVEKAGGQAAPATAALLKRRIGELANSPPAKQSRSNKK